VKKFIAFAVKATVTIALFILLFQPERYGLASDFWGQDISVKGLLDEIRGVQTHNIALWLLFAIIVKLAGMLSGVIRWRLLLHGQGLRLPFWYMVQSWFVGRFIGIFLPGTIGLDGYRLYDSGRYTGDWIKCTTVIAVEKLIGFIALTLLVFLTFPLGMSLLSFKVPVLVLCMLIFGGFVVLSLLTLLNPHLIQIVFAVLPVPRKVRGNVERLGAAAAAYSGNRKNLLWAVFFGILVHVGTCLMYFGTMSAIRADNTTIFDIFFTSPLMIWGTVLGPSVGGEGIREIVFTTVLGAKSGTAKAFLIAHLGWWVGELVPFIIGAPIFFFRSRPKREVLEAQLRQAREKAAETRTHITLSPGVVADYRRKLTGCLFAGAAAGLVGGALLGLAEAQWITSHLSEPREVNAYGWAPPVYGLLFTGCGLAVSAALAFLYMLVDRFLSTWKTFALSLGATLFAGAGIIGLFLLKRDVYEGHMPEIRVLALVVGGAALIGFIAAALGFAVERIVTRPLRRPTGAVTATVLACVVIWALGLAAARVFRPETQIIGEEHLLTAHNRPVILIAADACRADYLPLFNPDSPVRTPALDQLAADGVVFTHAFAQASWTKPSFATLFTGLYPRSHTATSKMATLPDEVTTVAEVLQAGGYYTKGFSNNPNITSTVNFGQGFDSYIDLKPAMYFGAPPSAERMSMYQVLRRVKQRLFSRRMVVTDFYQPAEIVTRHGLEWLDQKASDEDFFLFLHYMDTHDPFMDPEAPNGGYARVRIENPDPELAEPMRRAYYREIEWMDKGIQDLLGGLKARGLYDDAMIIFLSDHGEEFYDHGGWWHGQTLYDELIRVPLIIKPPAGGAYGQTSTMLARHIDIAPTIIAFAGLEQPEAMTGVSLFDQQGQPTALETAYIYAENDFEGIELEAVRTAETKLIHANKGNKRDLKPVEYYDLTVDPGETESLADQNLPNQEELEKVMEGMQAFIADNAAEPVLLESLDELEEQLNAIGYME